MGRGPLDFPRCRQVQYLSHHLPKSLDLDFDAAGSKVLWIQLEGSSSMDTLDRKAAAFHS